MKNTNILIYHHNDLDGYGAAAAACNGMRNDVGEKADELNFTFAPIAFPTTWETFVNDEVDPKKYDRICILDYGFTVETMNILTDLVKYVEETCRVVYWIDHHLTSVEPSNTLDKMKLSKLIHYVDDKRSAAWLAYEFFYHQDDDDIWQENVPPIIRAVDDYDRWVHHYPESMLINNAWYCSTELKDPTSAEWQSLLNDWSQELFAKLVEQGKVIEQYRNLIADSRKKFAYKVEIDGFPQYTAVALNDRGNSKCFSDLVKEYQVCILYHENRPGEIAMSLYSDPEFVKQGVDVSKIAIRHHGGGHPGASGCSMTAEEFRKVFKPVK